ncbi:MAG: AAA family ATPase, partial [Candidatus Heimdallarchaeota archaeon]|nr:AAA family ATPase [Candidatus Heimdallarchaeota archaeon]MCK4609613.1 AAA family ATPase [Candidatus Heimdallarchaeota archaeon]
MIIEKLTLQNFGVYEGKNEIIFPNNARKNIVVFIGKNGSGKTTILEALKIALYGPLLYGFKTVNDSYLEIIKEKINNEAYISKRECSLNLEFTKVENSESVRYEIMRKWKIDSKSISEELSIYKNETQLSELEINILENYLRQFLPPALIDLFFFD